MSIVRARQIIDQVRGRLLAMASRPPYRFKATRRTDARRYQESARTFVGAEETELAALERRIGGPLPAVYRTFAATMGRHAGDLFCGSDVGSDRWPELHRMATELVVESGADFTLPADAHVFLVHQGYQFSYVLADAGFDGPVYLFDEGSPEPAEQAGSFAELLASQLELMEQVHRQLHERGGYFLTVGRDGSVHQQYPALASGVRALDHQDHFVD
jgi:hypothetical protein